MKNPKTNQKIVVSVKDVRKTFRLPHESHSGLKNVLINIAKKQHVKGYEVQEVLKSVSFDVQQGDFFGIVGRNGSGKSTLLKILAGIYTPDSGNVHTEGMIVPFIELGVGFNPELTGRENVFLNGALLGFSRKETEKMYDEIVEFAELDRFMDQRLKNYSSGMQVRLAFSIAIKAKGDILILDEVLAVGDEAFQRKCDIYFNQIKKDKSKTVILVTHSMDSVKKYCNKAILIKNGKILVAGNPSDVANQYTEENTNTDTSKKERINKELGLSDNVPVFRINSKSKKVISRDKNFDFEIEYEFNDTKQIILAYSLTDIKRGGVVYDSGLMKLKDNGHQKLNFSLPMAMFNDTDFQIVATLRIQTDEDDGDLIAFTNEENSCNFSVRSNDEKSDYALLHTLK